MIINQYFIIMEKKMHPQSVELLEVLQKTMIAANYSKRSIPTYTREIRYVCAYYPDLSPHQWTDAHIIDYMSYLKLVHKVSYSKSKIVAQSVAFFFRHVLKRPYDVPSKLYPKREYKLPSCLTKEQMQQLITVLSPKSICLKVLSQANLCGVVLYNALSDRLTNMQAYHISHIKHMHCVTHLQHICLTMVLIFILSKNC